MPTELRTRDDGLHKPVEGTQRGTYMILFPSARPASEVQMLVLWLSGGVVLGQSMLLHLTKQSAR